MATKCILLAVLTIYMLSTAADAQYPSRPGKCPAPSLTPAQCRLVRFATCQGDNTCQGTQKCCNNGCGLACATPVNVPTRVTEKPGSCSPPSVQGRCANLCQNDASCKDDLKCCKTGCGGTVCSKPVTQQPDRPINVPGSCPAPKSHPGPWVCGNTCASDIDCVQGEKCCKNRCGASVCTLIKKA